MDAADAAGLRRAMECWAAVVSAPWDTPIEERTRQRMRLVAAVKGRHATDTIRGRLFTGDLSLERWRERAMKDEVACQVACYAILTLAGTGLLNK